MTCAHCSARFVPRRSWQRFCSAKCKGIGSRKVRREKRQSAVRPPGTPALCQQCGTVIPNPRSYQKFCSERCRGRSHAPPPVARIRRLFCHKCGGSHRGSECTRKSAPVPRSAQLGTMGPDREYVPYPGSRVRVITIPHTVHGDTVGALLERRKPC